MKSRAFSEGRSAMRRSKKGLPGDAERPNQLNDPFACGLLPRYLRSNGRGFANLCCLKSDDEQRARRLAFT